MPEAQRIRVQSVDVVRVDTDRYSGRILHLKQFSWGILCNDFCVRSLVNVEDLQCVQYILSYKYCALQGSKCCRSCKILSLLEIKIRHFCVWFSQFFTLYLMGKVCWKWKKVFIIDFQSCKLENFYNILSFPTGNICANIFPTNVMIMLDEIICCG